MPSIPISSLPRLSRRLLAGLALVAFALLVPREALAAGGGHGDAPAEAFPPTLASYDDAGQSIVERLAHRAEANPFNLIATLIFVLAVLHTFLAGRFQTLATFFSWACS